MAIPASSLFNLTGAVALVSGGGTGIGLMAARGLASQGAKVYITGRRLPVLESAAKAHNPALSQHGGSLVPIQVDVTDKKSLEAAAQQIEKADGRLHVLVNNAGVEGPVVRFNPEEDFASGSEADKASLIAKRFWDSETFDDWESAFRPNVSAVFFATMAFLPLLIRGNEKPPKQYVEAIGSSHPWTASIINITSISGLVKTAQNHYPYNASKAAANHITQMLAHELQFSAKVGVRVNAIAPGMFATEMTTKVSTMETGGQSRQSDLDPRHTNPAGRAGLEEDMAQAILFLSACRFTTGVVLPVDGGFVTSAASSR
ncbi:unnamed protein product [Parajaminaea phylloscopi]